MKKYKKYVIIVFLILVCFISIISVRIYVENVNDAKKQEELSNFSYETKMFKLNDDYTYTFETLVTIQELDGIDKIVYKSEGKNEVTVEGNGKEKIAIDFQALENKEYDIRITPVGKTEKIEKLKIERKTAGKDTYRLVKGVYLNVPFLENFNSNYTRYAKLTPNNTLTAGNWISGEEPENWYDYKNSQWANVYVELEGIEMYYVWIPRYMYKLDNQNQKSDIKFVDVFNNYIDAQTGQKLTYAQLLEQGYKLPEAFEFGDSNESKNGLIYTSLSGYYVSKYQLSELEGYKLNYNMTAKKNSIKVNSFVNNVSDKTTYFTYSINGQIKDTKNSLDDYTFTDLEEGKMYVVNVTAYDEQDGIVTSMTKRIEPVEVNAPDLDGFNKNKTFYVIYNEDGTKDTSVPISQPAPNGWYDYTIADWANIVVKTDDNKETYYVWIPRYQYRLNNTIQKSDIKFVLGTERTTEAGYKIPDAFWWDKNDNQVEDDGEQLTGYWVTKYQLVDE